MSLIPILAPDTQSDPAGQITENLDNLEALFPSAFHEGKIDFEVLRQLLGAGVDDAPERYGLNWHGKRAARQLALTPSAGTLRPEAGQSMDWDNTRNLMIEGDNMEVLKLLQKPFAGRVKLIYIDPPYNTGKDLIYRDDFRDNIKNYLEITGQIGEGGAKLTTNSESSGRFHTDWLNMMLPRLSLARNLLRKDGVIFISIGEAEIANLLCLCDHVFGPECALGVACRVAKKSNNKGEFWAPNFDYIVTYARDKSTATPFSGGINTPAYDQIEADGPRAGERYQLVRLYMSTIENQNPEQRYWIKCPDGTSVIPPGSTFPPDRPKLGDGIWRWTRAKFEAERGRIVIKSVRSSNLLDENRQPAKWNVFTKTFLNDVIAEATSKPNNLIENHINQAGSHEMTALGIPFDYPKPSTLVRFLSEISQTRGDDIILDFFAGSGTTGDAVMSLNASDGGCRRYILVQLPERLDPNNADQKVAAEFCDQLGKPRTIAELTKERLRRAAKRIRDENRIFAGDLGFRVFRLDSSNIRPWPPAAGDIQHALLESVDHLKHDRSEQDIFYEILLRLNLDLCMAIETRAIGDKNVHSAGAGTLFACLDPAINAAEVEELALGIAAWRDELHPAGEPTVVFRDSAFASDVAKANCVAILRQSGFADSNLRSI